MSKALILTRLVTVGPENRATLLHMGQGVRHLRERHIPVQKRNTRVPHGSNRISNRKWNVSEGGWSRGYGLRVSIVYFLCLNSKAMKNSHQVILFSSGSASNETTLDLDLPHRGQSLGCVFFMFSSHEHYLLALYVGSEMSWWDHTSFWMSSPAWVVGRHVTP